MSGIRFRLREWRRMAKREVLVLWLAARDPRVPWYAKLLAASVAAYALSPIDLIPDFIPVLGYVDDLLIVPAGIYLAVRLIPRPVLDDLRRAAEAQLNDPRPRSVVAATIIVVVWVALAGATVWLAWPMASSLVGSPSL